MIGGPVAAAGAWVAPSVLTLDRVAAATGTCGAPAVQVDWSDWTPSDPAPGSVTANDGTIVTLSSSDPLGVAGPDHFTLLNDTLGGTSDFLASEMDGASNGQYVDITLAFSTAVQLCFTLLDVDRNSIRWEDTVTVMGTLSGVPVTLTPSDIVTGPDNTFVASNTIRGILNGNTADSSAGANATVAFPSPIDEVVIRYSDVSIWTAGQMIGIHDLLWC
jgi:hypothetical protein